MKKNAKIAVKIACKESATKIIVFRLYLSDITPAIGKSASVGIKKRKLANDSIKTLPVTSVIHTNMTKKTTSDPNNEKS